MTESWWELRPYLLATFLSALVGMERERHFAQEEDIHAAGIRTFSIVGMLGAAARALDGTGLPIFTAVGFASVTLMVIAGYWAVTRRGSDPGMTTEVSLFVTYAIGALSASGRELLAAIVTVLLVSLLSLKGALHRFSRSIQPEDVSAALRFAIVSVVILPLLPDRAMGPMEILNPRRVWWMVVLISGLGFAAYVAFQLFGQRRGTLVTALLGGLVSSTAITLTFAGVARAAAGGARYLGLGILIAWVTMFPRVLVEVGIVAPRLLEGLVVPFGAMALSGFAVILVRWRKRPVSDSLPVLRNPLSLWVAIQFGLIYGVVLFLSRFAQLRLGDAGVYAASAAGGMIDVDAIVLSLSSLVRSGLSEQVAVEGIVLAALMNTLAKAVLCWSIGGRSLDWTPTIGFLAIVGAAGLWWAISF
ncbi:MAG: MgtC/SapB family protein [Myxococcales bacterium]|nr:MgtC/SapB family protein [Myxococcales bacterium]